MNASPNRLERALARAAEDEPYRADFYRVLMESDVFVLGLVEGRRRKRPLRDGDRIAIAGSLDEDGTRVIPFFSSLQALRCGPYEEERETIRIPVRALFDLTAGSRLVLNPGSEYGKEFFPGEVRRLLDWAEDGAEIQTVTIERDTQVLLAPAKYHPREAARALYELLAAVPEVRAAYLGQVVYPEKPGEPHLVVGIDAGDAYRAVVGRLRQHAGVLAEFRQVVDLVPMDGRGMSRYLASTEPFYTRGWTARLRAILPFGRGRTARSG